MRRTTDAAGIASRSVSATPITAEFLDELVERTDTAGGIGSPDVSAVWADMQGVVAPEDMARFDGIDPFSEAYGDLQLELWAQWSGRDYDPSSTELTDFDMEAHLTSRTSYGPHAPPLILAHHYLSVARAVSALGVEGVRALEIGAGWGLQAELLSELGFEVDVVDINADFLSLITERMAARGFGGRQHQGTFTDFTVPEGGYDLVYTYEALHHTPQPLAAIRRFVDPAGAAAKSLAFVGEPVVDMWPSWGLRTDQESLYCIRKFGWFESGWTDAFILSCIARVGLGAHLMRTVSSDRDGCILGAPVQLLDPDDRSTWTPFVAGWARQGDGLMSLGESSLAFSVEDEARSVVLDLGWYNPLPTIVHVTLLCGEHVDQARTEVLPGTSELVLQLPPGNDRIVTVRIEGETWCPRSVLGTEDRRRISIDVLAVRADDRDPLQDSRPVWRAVPRQSPGFRAAAKQRLRRLLYSAP